MLPPGRYLSYVVATDGTLVAAQSVAVRGRRLHDQTERRDTGSPPVDHDHGHQRRAAGRQPAGDDLAARLSPPGRVATVRLSSTTWRATVKLKCGARRDSSRSRRPARTSPVRRSRRRGASRSTEGTTCLARTSARRSPAAREPHQTAPDPPVLLSTGTIVGWTPLPPRAKLADTGSLTEEPCVAHASSSRSPSGAPHPIPDRRTGQWPARDRAQRPAGGRRCRGFRRFGFGRRSRRCHPPDRPVRGGRRARERSN